VHRNAPIYLAGRRPSRSQVVVTTVAVHALARLGFAGLIDNVQCSWVKLGDEQTAELLRGGANDIGGTLMEETISRMAGSEHGSARTVAELVPRWRPWPDDRHGQRTTHLPGSLSSYQSPSPAVQHPPCRAR